MKIVPGMQYGDFTILYQSRPMHIVVQCNRCSSIYEIKLGTIIKRCKNCNPKTKMYEYNGKQYTVKELAEIAKCSDTTMRRLLRNNSVEESISIGKKLVPPSRNNTPHIYNGKEYTIKELAELAGCSAGAMSYRLRNGLSIKDAVEKRFIIGVDINKTKLYNYNGKEYTVKELAELAGCSYNCMLERLKHYPVEEAINKDPNIKTYNYQGKYYTARQLAKLAGCSYRSFLARLHKYSVEEAVNGDFTPGLRLSKLYTYKGKEYTIKELAELAGCSVGALKNRLSKYSIEEAVELKSKNKNK